MSDKPYPGLQLENLYKSVQKVLGRYPVYTLDDLMILVHPDVIDDTKTLVDHYKEEDLYHGLVKVGSLFKPLCGKRMLKGNFALVVEEVNCQSCRELLQKRTKNRYG